MCGVTTNVITAVEIHGKGAADCSQLPLLLDSTADRFKVAEVSGDLAYSTHSNLEAVAEVGAIPYIPFKRNASGTAGGLWAKMFHYFNFSARGVFGEVPSAVEYRVDIFDAQSKVWRWRAEQNGYGDEERSSGQDGLSQYLLSDLSDLRTGDGACVLE